MRGLAGCARSGASLPPLAKPIGEPGAFQARPWRSGREGGEPCSARARLMLYLPTMAMLEHKLQDDCFAHDRRRLRHDEALAILKARVRPVVGVEQLLLAQAAGRILAAAARAPHAVPASDDAAVDGSAVAATDYAAAAGTSPTPEGRAAAGHGLAVRPTRATAARICTGAMMPEGHDTVVMQEDVRINESDGRTTLSIPAGLKRGANVRQAGEDVEEGETVLAPGAVLRPQDLS